MDSVVKAIFEQRPSQKPLFHALSSIEQRDSRRNGNTISRLYVVPDFNLLNDEIGLRCMPRFGYPGTDI